MTASILVTSLLACSIILVSCDGATITEPQDVIFPDSNVRFRGHVQPFLAVTCATGGCHGDVNVAGGIRLTSYTTVMFDRPNLFVSTKPDESLVIHVLEGKIGHPVGDINRRVSSAQVKGMRQWVLEGALNN